MKKMIICILLLGYYAVANGQNSKELVGKYNTQNESHNNRHHYEEVVLNADSTFNYFARPAEFVQLRKKGRWTVNGDTVVLNEYHPAYNQVILVTESINKKIKKGCVSINLSYYDGTELNFQIAVDHGDTTVLLRNQFRGSVIKLFPIDHFYINGPLFRYPKYVVKDKKSNVFNVKVSPQVLFINEKWLVVNGSLRPRGFDNEYASYYLKKINEKE